MARSANRGRAWVQRTGYQLPEEDQHQGELSGDEGSDQVQQQDVPMEENVQAADQQVEDPTEHHGDRLPDRQEQVQMTRQDSAEATVEDIARLGNKMDKLSIVSERKTDEVISSMAQLINAINSLHLTVRELKDRIATLEHENKVQHEQFNSTIRSFDSYHVLPKIHSLIMKQEQQHDGECSCSGEPSSKRKRPDADPKTRYCYICRSIGHIADACSTYEDGESRGLALDKYGRCRHCAKAIIDHKGEACPYEKRRCQHCGKFHLNAICETRYPKKTAKAGNPVLPKILNFD